MNTTMTIEEFYNAVKNNEFPAMPKDLTLDQKKAYATAAMNAKYGRPIDYQKPKRKPRPRKKLYVAPPKTKAQLLREKADRLERDLSMYDMNQVADRYITKLGRKWAVDGNPCLFKTKRAAREHVFNWPDAWRRSAEVLEINNWDEVC